MPDGVYGEATDSAVNAFKNLFNIPGAEGRVTALLWNAITNVYDDLYTGATVRVGQFPGIEVS